MTAAALHPSTRPRVLFVGHDASSPQIAANLMHVVVGDLVEVETADSQPAAERGGRTDEMLVGMGLNPADERRLSAGALHTADRVVILGTGIDVARLPGPRYEEWDLTREDLISRVEALCDELTCVPAAKPRSTPLSRLRRLLAATTR